MKKSEVAQVYMGADEQSWQELLDDLRPQGKWIIKPKENSQSAILICNKCNHFIPITIDKNFCPNCGADMRGKEE